MPRRAPIPKCSEKDRKSLEELARSRTEEARIVERAKIILRCLAGERVHKIAKKLGVRPNTVIEWRRRFEEKGIEGLKDRPRSGKPVFDDAAFRERVLKTLELPPPPAKHAGMGRAHSCETSRYLR